MNQFYSERLQKIKKLDSKQYIDNGPSAIYHVMCAYRERMGLPSTIFDAALIELERLYGLNQPKE